MTDLPQVLKDNTDPRKYFAMIERMADDDLNLYEYRLYGHYKQVCGNGGGQCWEGVRKTAKHCDMSIGKASQARRGLIDKGFITMTLSTEFSEAGNAYITGAAVELVDRWLDNVKRYSPDEQGCSRTEQGCSQGELNNNSKNKNASGADAKKKRQRAAPKQAENGRVPAAVMNPMKDAIASAFGWSWDTMTNDEQGQIQKAAKQLCEVSVNPSDIPYYYAYCKSTFTNFGPVALVNHKSEADQARKSSPSASSPYTGLPKPSPAAPAEFTVEIPMPAGGWKS